MSALSFLLQYQWREHSEIFEVKKFPRLYSPVIASAESYKCWRKDRTVHIELTPTHPGSSPHVFVHLNVRAHVRTVVHAKNVICERERGQSFRYKLSQTHHQRRRREFVCLEVRHSARTDHAKCRQQDSRQS